MSEASCWPWFHQIYADLAAQAWTKATIPSGCSTNYNTGDITCSPESMRAAAEAWLARNAPQALVHIGGRLALEVYTFARYMHSELGGGTIEERVAIGEAGLHRAKRSGRSISQLLMPRGYYGPIHAPDYICEAKGLNCAGKSGHCCAPYGRWAATSRDPSVMAILLAHLIVTGESRNFSRDADDQDGPEAWVSGGQTALTNYVRKLANSGKYWVGPLAGVDHWKTFLQFTPDLATRALRGNELLQRGIAALTLPRRSPSWGSLPLCNKPMSTGQTFFLAMAGIAAGVLAGTWVARRYIGQIV